MKTKTGIVSFILLNLLCFSANAQLKANFSANVTSGCTDFDVQFSDQSTGNPNSWFWDFGNGTSSTSKNPKATYTAAGTYNVRLIIRNGNNSDYIEKKNYITVSQTPVASFTFTPTQGCVPLDVNFTNTTNLFGEPMQKWSWDFGDGNTGAAQDPVHKYTSAGTFNAVLTAINASGCSSSYTQTIITGNKPNANFSATPLDGCNTPRIFTDQSTGSINSWQWDFGDGGTSTLQNPRYSYTDTGWFSVKLVVGSNGCLDSVTINKYIHVKAPVAAMRQFVGDCADPYTVFFKGYLSKGVQQWSWDFGDGGTANSANPNHTYGAAGIYVVKLKVQANGCTDVATDSVFITAQNPSYQISPSRPSYCKYDTVNFTATNYNPLYLSSFAWDFGDGNITNFNSNSYSVTHTYFTSGNFNPVMYAKTREGCIDTVTRNNLTITVNGPTAAFNFSNPACINSTVIFKDQSQPYNNIPLTRWVWDYGDGNNNTQTAPPFSYVYSIPGTFHVILKLFDSKGCYDTVSHYITIADTPVIDAGKDTFLCAGQSATMNPTGGVSYVWANNPFLSCTNCTNPVVTPTDSTVLYVTGQNAAGCTATDSVQIFVQKAQTLSAQPLNDTICVGGSVQLSASGMNNYQWQPPTSLSNANIAKPVASPLTTTIYTVTGKDNIGCFTNTATVNIVVNPLPVINISDTDVTILQGSTYQLQTTNSADVSQWQWQPSQWLSNATIPNPVAQPLTDVTYTCVAGNKYGCVTRDQITIHVTCNNSTVYIPNTFSPNGDGQNDYFYPRSSLSLTFKSFRIFNRWGQVVFQVKNFPANDQATAWNGNFNGKPAPADVYVYVLEYVCASGTVLKQTGNITLIR